MHLEQWFYPGGCGALQEHLATSDIFVCHSWEGSYWSQVGGDQGCCQMSYNVQDSPQQYLVQNVSGTEVEKP